MSYNYSMACAQRASSHCTAGTCERRKRLLALGRSAHVKPLARFSGRHVTSHVAVTSRALPALPTRLSASHQEVATTTNYTTAEAAHHNFAERNSWFRMLLDIQTEIEARVAARHPLARAHTRYSDEGGAYTMTQLEKGVYVKTQTFNGGAVDWGYKSTALAEGMGFAYTKTTMFPHANTATPNLDVEIGGTVKELLLWASLTPRLGVVSHPEYAERYYSSRPNPSIASFVEVERAAAQRPQYKRFVSPSTMVRALSATALVFNAPASREGFSALREDALAVTDLWLAWVDTDQQQQQQAAHGLGSGGGPPHPDLAVRHPKDLTVLTGLMRDVMRRDPSLVPQRAVLGDDAVERWLEVMSGRAHL